MQLVLTNSDSRTQLHMQMAPINPDYPVFLGLARTVYIHVYDRIFGDFSAKVTVHTPYIYGSGQPYVFYVACKWFRRFRNIGLEI